MSVFFSRFVVTHQVFFQTKHTYALVNLKPLVPGHVLVVPLRVVAHLADLTPEESADYMASLQTVHRFILHHYRAAALNIAIQDGPEAGQSVPHLHTHLIPRHASDHYGDAIYGMLDKWDGEAQLGEWHRRREAYKQSAGFVATADEDRKPRSDAEMQTEAQELARALAVWQKQAAA